MTDIVDTEKEVKRWIVRATYEAPHRTHFFIQLGDLSILCSQGKVVGYSNSMGTVVLEGINRIQQKHLNHWRAYNVQAKQSPSEFYSGLGLSLLQEGEALYVAAKNGEIMPDLKDEIPERSDVDNDLDDLDELEDDDLDDDLDEDDDDEDLDDDDLDDDDDEDFDDDLDDLEDELEMDDKLKEHEY